MTVSDLDQRAADAAARWIGTPYRHQASLFGVGADCLGLVRGVWREILGDEPIQPGPYSMDWAETGNEDRLLDAANMFFVPVERAAIDTGCLILFRWSPQFAAKHAGICVSKDHFVHAYSGVGVVQSPLVASWRKRIVGVFRFPEPHSHMAAMAA
jgi:NlpC/P60 family putative phage cell wall peptidase